MDNLPFGEAVPMCTAPMGCYTKAVPTQGL